MELQLSSTESPVLHRALLCFPGAPQRHHEAVSSRRRPSARRTAEDSLPAWMGRTQPCSGCTSQSSSTTRATMCSLPVLLLGTGGSWVHCVLKAQPPCCAVPWDVCWYPCSRPGAEICLLLL